LWSLAWVLFLGVAACGGPDPTDLESADDSAAIDDGKADAPAKTVTVKVGAGGAHSFSPKTVKIKKGDTVKWIWGSDFHTVTSGPADRPDGLFDSGGPAPSGTVFTHTFTTTGTFPYVCVPHADHGMTGTVTVK
jgi:plastocyanin